jgi:hypothetical protein
VQTANAASEQKRRDALRSKDLVVHRTAVGNLTVVELRRLAMFLGVPQSTTELGKTTLKKSDVLLRDVRQYWDAEKSRLGDRIAVPSPPEKRGAKAQGWKSIAK